MMYAKYVYNTSATLANIHDDVFEIFCGETTKSNLSAGCDQTNTDIRTTYTTSPWVDFDDVSATERIMRLESSDDSGVYKYVGWHTGGSNELAFAVMASWDAGTDTPTDEAPAEFNYQSMAVYPGTGGTIHIYSSTFCTILCHQSVANLWGNASTPSNWGSLGIFEVDRSHPSHALGDMPNWFMCCTAMCWGDSDVNMDAVFWQGRDETDTVLKPFRSDMSYPGRDNAWSDLNSYAIAGAIGSATALTAIGADTSFGVEPMFLSGSFVVSNQDSTTYYGSVSARCDIWMMAPGTANCGDLVIIDGVPYFVLKMGYAGGSTTGAQYGGKLIVPYG